MACWLTLTIFHIQVRVLSGAKLPLQTNYDKEETRNSATTHCSVNKFNKTLHYKLNNTSIICTKTIEINKCGGLCPSVYLPSLGKLLVSYSLCQPEHFTFQYVKLDCPINGNIKEDVQMKVQMVTSCACRMYLRKKRRRKIRSYIKLSR